jgi:UDP-N-acetylglucosamine/UDP-N-acetylgalactosamine diphosphorylase
MTGVPDEIQTSLCKFGQEHVLAGWEKLSPSQRADFLHELKALDFQELRQLFLRRHESIALPSRDCIFPPEAIDADRIAPAAIGLGNDALDRGAVAVLLVAGGQGSRLGFEHSKGMYPIGPVSRKSLFQIHAEKTLAITRRHGKPIPFLVMTSPDTHDETARFFEDGRFFGLRPSDVYFFCQGTMPALDMQTGRLLLERPGKLFTSPNGHGGTLKALVESNLLTVLEERGIREVFYFQVDNPLVKIADAAFLGHHLQADALASSKIVPKEGPADKLGNMAVVDGRCAIIEYSDLPEELANLRDPCGRLWLWAGSPAIHIFSVAFLKQVALLPDGIRFHIARKKVAFDDAAGNRVEPERENALKFEMFIFDVLPLAERWTVVQTRRDEEFVPLKNACGPDSPKVVQQAISNLAGQWLATAKIRVPRGPDGNVAFPVEISPLFALDPAELAERVDPALEIKGPTYLA